MERFRTTILAMLALVMMGAPASAGGGLDVEHPTELSLSDAIELALEANPEVLRAREQVDEFRLQVREVRSRALPKLDLHGSYAHSRDPGLRNSPSFSDIAESGFLPPEALEALSFDTYTYRFDLEQPIYTFGKVGKAIKVARHELDGVQTDARGVERRVAYQVAVAYYDLLLAHVQHSVLETERATRERQLQQVRDRKELEDATRLDVLRAEVALANLRPEILATENAMEVALARLNETLGRAVTEPLTPLQSLSLPDPLPEVPEPEALRELALATRPELLRFALTRQVLEQAVGVTRADTLPEIRANASFGVSSFALENLKDNSFRNWNVGVSLNWTLFDGFKTSSTIGRLRSQSRQNDLQQEAFRRQLAREIEQASGQWERGLEAAQVAALAVEQAHEAARVADESYRWGAATVLDILEAERAVRQAELTRAQAHYTALTALANMKYLVGLRADHSFAMGETESTVAPESGSRQ